MRTKQASSYKYSMCESRILAHSLFHEWLQKVQESKQVEFMDYCYPNMYLGTGFRSLGVVSHSVWAVFSCVLLSHMQFGGIYENL